MVVVKFNLDLEAQYNKLKDDFELFIPEDNLEQYREWTRVGEIYADNVPEYMVRIEDEEQMRGFFKEIIPKLIPKEIIESNEFRDLRKIID